MYKSQELARMAPEIGALRLGMGWSPEDLRSRRC
ncbi:MAG: hypothetical protein PWQ41_1145 [Bacillota bacterium]|jgi:hypothetical protein|nr:hypothetical protein [Bacillota bacterium]MDK2925371.1 hypothetical protein [Bacillota bacterium]